MPRPARLFLLLLALLTLLAALPPASGRAQEPRNVVERWRGTITVSKRFNTAGTPAELLYTGHQLEQYTLRYDLAVDDDGFTNGDVFITLNRVGMTVGGDGFCGLRAVKDCAISASVVQGRANQFWEGRRFVDAQGKPRLKLDIQVDGGAAPTIRTSMCGYMAPLYLTYGCVPGETTEWATDLPEEFIITPYQQGRSPLATPLNAHYSDATMSWDYVGQLVGAGREPTLDLDTELLERSRFFTEVPLEDQLDATIGWNSPDGGHVQWQIGQQGEQMGPTRQPKVSTKTNVGPASPGTRPVVVQARTTLNQSSNPATTNLTAIRWPVSAESPANISATKLNSVAAYRYALRFPTPAFKAKIDKVPAIVPYFGGESLGITDTQASGEGEILSTGEGFVKLDGKLGFEAMGGSVAGAVGVKGQAVQSAQYGVQYPSGDFSLSVAGKIEKKIPVVELIPATSVLASKIKTFSPATQAALEKIAVQGEIEPKFELLFKLKDEQGRIAFVSGEARAGIGIKTNLVFELVEDTVLASVGVGGEVVQGLRVPPPYLTDTEIKLLANIKAVVGIYQFEAEYSVTCVYNGASLSCRVPPTLAAQLNATANLWRALDRSYTQHPDYGRWTGAEPAVAGPGVVDQRLVAAVSPQSGPAIAIEHHDFVGARYTHVVWAHDHAEKPLASARELHMTTQNEVGGWGDPQRLTSDDRDDWGPQIALAPSGAQLLLWQRMDTATPPDINADPSAYLSHMQIAAGKVELTAGVARVTPLQLSAGGVSYRPQLAGTADGAVAVWITNPGNQLGGDAAHPDALMFSRYTQSSNSWSGAAQVLPPLAGLVDYSLASNGGHAAIAFTRDTDGDRGTAGDSELFVTRYVGGAWSAPQRLTTNTAADEHPQLALAADGSPLLVWTQAGALVFLSGAWGGAPKPVGLPAAAGRPDYRLVRAADDSLALVWQELEPEDTQIGYAVYDRASGLWGAAQTVTPPADATMQRGSMATSIAPALTYSPVDSAKEQLVVAYLLAETSSVTRTVDGVSMPNVQQVGAHSLHVANERIGANLSLSPADITVTPADAKPGQSVQVRAVVRNTGQRPLGGLPVELLSSDPEDPFGQPDVVGTRTLPLLRSGEAYTVTYSLTRPEEARTWGLSIPQQFEECPGACVPRPVETDYSDNYARITAGLSMRPLPAAYTPQGVMLSAQVAQSGALYSTAATSATLRLDAPDGPLVGDVGVAFPISRTGAIDVTAWIAPAALGPGSHTLYWELDPGHKQTATGSTQFAVPVDVLPDLASDAALIGWGRAPGASAPLSVRVENRGSWPSAASAAELWDGPPGAAGSHKLGRLAIPAIPAGGAVELTGTLTLSGTPAAQSGLKALYVRLDPDGALAEVNENNNLIVAGQPTFSASPPPPPGSNRLYLPLLLR